MGLYRMYRETLDAVEIANTRYFALVNQPVNDEPLAETADERRTQFARWSRAKAQRQPAIVAAASERARCIAARDAAFAALKGQ